MNEYDYIVLGAGIGGASVAYRLAAHSRVALLEQEEQPGYHTTGRSVAVHTDSYGPAVVRRFAKASLDFLLNPPEDFSDAPLQHPLGLAFVATEEQRDDMFALLEMVRQISPHIREISLQDLQKRVPVMKIDQLAASFYDDQTIGLDVNAIHQGYLRGAKRAGGELFCRAEVKGLEYRSDRWHVETTAGEFAAPVVINSAGAWVDVIAGMAGTRKIDIVPKRRTCIAFPVPDGVDVTSWPGIIDTHENYYFKPDAGNLIGSLGDETPDAPHDVQPEELDVAMTVDRIENATTMTINKLIQKWAGLRNFVADKEPVIGYAPDAEGFFWNAAQGGYGIATSPAWSDCADALIRGNDLPDYVLEHGVSAEQFAPQRLWEEL